MDPSYFSRRPPTPVEMDSLRNEMARPTWVPEDLADFRAECAVYLPLTNTISVEHIEIAVHSNGSTKQRFVARNPNLNEEQCRYLLPVMPTDLEKAILSSRPAFPMDLLMQLALTENSLMILAFILYNPKVTKEIGTIVRLRWGSKAVGNRGERTKYEEKHTDQFEWLKETKNIDDIDTAVYGEHHASRIWVIRNSRLTEDHVRHLVPMFRESAFLAFPLLYCPNVPTDVLLDLALTESDPAIRRMVGNHRNADEETQILVALQIPDGYDPL